jgi:integrase
VGALISHKVAQNAQRLKLPAGLWTEWGLVFPTRRGTPFNYRNLTSRYFKSLLSRAELPHTVRFHDLRHTCATFSLAEVYILNSCKNCSDTPTLP